MLNGRKRLFVALNASIWLAASGLPAPPAAQALPPNYGKCQYDPYARAWYRNYVYGSEPCTPSVSESYGVCVYDEYSDSWVIHYVFGDQPCDPVYPY